MERPQDVRVQRKDPLGEGRVEDPFRRDHQAVSESDLVLLLADDSRSDKDVGLVEHYRVVVDAKGLEFKRELLLLLVAEPGGCHKGLQL